MVVVAALPLKPPTKVVVVSVLVLGLNVSPVPRLAAWLLSDEEETKSG